MRAINTTTISILALGLLAGTTVGVAAQDEEMAAGAVSFTGSGRGGPQVSPGRTTETDLPKGYTAVDGFTYRNTWESTDERLTGDLIGVNDYVIDPGGHRGGGFPNMIMSLAIELTNDGGSWLGEGTAFGSKDLGIVREMYTLVGQGGYEGLTAYAIVEAAEVGAPPRISGTIFPTAMPEVPEPYSGE